MKIKRLLFIFGKVLKAVLLVFIIVILLSNVYTAAAKKLFGQKNPTFFGFTSSVVLTGSMSPAIEPNDLVITHKQSGYSAGDIITFYSEGSSVTHRIITADTDGYRTQGDANNAADLSPVKDESVTGRVILVIPKIGALFGFVKTPLGMLCFLAAAALLIELPGIINYFKGNRDTD